MLADERVCCSQQNKMLVVVDNKHAGDLAVPVVWKLKRLASVVARNSQNLQRHGDCDALHLKMKRLSAVKEPQVLMASM